MKTKRLLMCAVALIWGSFAAHAESDAFGPRYVPRPAPPQGIYSETNRAEDRRDVRSYEEYEHREPCQRYRRLPRNYMDGCVRAEEEAVVADSDNTLAEARLLPVIHSYTVLFDFDKSDVRVDGAETINQVLREISRYRPEQITVTGYTDSSGSADYNMELSRRREQAVSSALLQHGVENQIIERDARGEYDQAVNTEDGVRNQENRRVVIDFRR